MSGGSGTAITSRHWWGRRWHQTLDDAAAVLARSVARGRALARRGAVEDLQVVPGRISGAVVEDRSGPRQVELRWSVPGEAAWSAAVELLAGQLRFTAALLEGELVDDVDEVLAGSGIRLLPRLDDLVPSCTCGAGDWCRHVAAVHTAAGIAIDRDPALLLRFRGRERDALLRAVRAAAGGPSEPRIGIEVPSDIEAPRGDLDAVVLRPAPAHDPGALLEHLGPPPGVEDLRPLTGIVERAAAGAWRLAAGDGADAADETLLLAELRAQRTATAGVLAEALGRDPDEVRDELDRLFAEGAVLRTGSGARARYRAASS